MVDVCDIPDNDIVQKLAAVAKGDASRKRYTNSTMVTPSQVYDRNIGVMKKRYKKNNPEAVC